VPSTAGINNSTTANTVVNSTTNIDATLGAEGVINIGNNGGTTAVDSSTTNIAGTVNFSGQVNIPAGDLNLGLANDEFYIGSVGNIATPQTISGDATITNAGLLTIGSNKVTYAKMQAMTTNKLLGSGTGTAVEEITLGTGLSFSGSTLNTVNNGNVTSGTLITNAPVYATGASAIATTATALTNGQLLIGSTSNPPVPATLGTGTGISITTGAGTLTVNNTGVTSAVAGTGISVSGATGAVTINNTGVTSVGLSMPSIFSTGSAVTTTGNLSATLNTETANTIFAGPTTGSAAAPTFRTLVSADYPANTINYGSLQSETASTLLGNPTGSSANTSVITLGAGLSFSGTTLVATGAVSSVTGNANGTLTISPTTGAVVAGLNLSNANTWSGTQTFGGAALTSSTPGILGAGPTIDWGLSASNSYFKVSSSTAAVVDGIANGTDGRVIVLVNEGTNTITFNTDASAETTAANKIHLAGGTSGNGYSLILAPDGFVTFIYDSTIAEWRVLSSK
jgi:hypothetical protein